MLQLYTSLIFLLTSLVIRSNSAVLSITRTGKYLFDSNGVRFYIKGVAYQRPGTIAPTSRANSANGGFPEPNDYLDPLVDITACTRDIVNFKTLKINTVRVYSINPYGDHSACMNALADSGIYVIADLALPLNGSINRADPSYNVALLDQYLVTLNNLLPFSNLLAVSVGNEVVTSTANSGAATFVKAVTRDIKAYLKSKGSNVLVSYSSADGSTWRSDLAKFLVCGSEAVSIDLYGLNNYEWCGSSTYATSGYQTLTNEFANFQVATYFSEFGCISSPRDWSDVPSIYSAPMTNVWSGAVAFEYFYDTLGYGLTANTSTNDGAITTNSQFTTLAAAYTAAISPTNYTVASTAASVYSPCLAATSNLIANAVLPSTPSYSVCNCLTQHAFSCVVNPSTSPLIVGLLLDYACSLYSTVGGSCAPISENGTTAVYGNISGCSSLEQLSWVATQYYEQQGQNVQACSYSGNTTVNSNAPNSSAGVSSAISQCLAAATSTFVPSLPSATSSSSFKTSVTGTSSGTSAAAAAASTSSTSKTNGCKRIELLRMGVYMIGGVMGLGFALM